MTVAFANLWLKNVPSVMLTPNSAPIRTPNRAPNRAPNSVPNRKRIGKRLGARIGALLGVLLGSLLGVLLVVCKMYTLQNAYHSAFPSVSSDTEQYSGIPSAASSSIFKRAYYLYQMLLLQEYIQDPAVSEALQAAHEDFDYCCFQPSWGEKGRRLFPYSLHLGEYSSNQVSDNVEDLRLAMKEYVEWMNAHFAVKWKHSCGECHVVDSKGQAVMDGKVMGHLLCRVIGCNLDIIGINTKFCINHAGLKGKCIISGCANQKRERENSFDYQPLSCKEVEHMEAVGKFFSDPSTTSEKTAKKYGGKTRVSVGHVKDDERNYEEFGFCYSPFDRFLPGVFLVVWSCGHIMDIGKMYSFESNKFIT
ncbi:hypothetical protein BDR26DRAFT_906323 [Obelidium mucronatum]|nr:hypothetical protein BDR26DRAFT_906323 [Obelidium mucronatum]